MTRSLALFSGIVRHVEQDLSSAERANCALLEMATGELIQVISPAGTSFQLGDMVRAYGHQEQDIPKRFFVPNEIPLLKRLDQSFALLKQQNLGSYQMGSVSSSLHVYGIAPDRLVRPVDILRKIGEYPAHISVSRSAEKATKPEIVSYIESLAAERTDADFRVVDPETIAYLPKRSINSVEDVIDFERGQFQIAREPDLHYSLTEADEGAERLVRSASFFSRGFEARTIIPYPALTDFRLEGMRGYLSHLESLSFPMKTGIPEKAFHLFTAGHEYAHTLREARILPPHQKEIFCDVFSLCVGAQQLGSVTPFKGIVDRRMASSLFYERDPKHTTGLALRQVYQKLEQLNAEGYLTSFDQGQWRAVAQDIAHSYGLTNDQLEARQQEMENFYRSLGAQDVSLWQRYEIVSAWAETPKEEPYAASNIAHEVTEALKAVTGLTYSDKELSEDHLVISLLDDYQERLHEMTSDYAEMPEKLSALFDKESQNVLTDMPEGLSGGRLFLAQQRQAILRKTASECPPAPKRDKSYQQGLQSYFIRPTARQEAPLFSYYGSLSLFDKWERLMSLRQDEVTLFKKIRGYGVEVECADISKRQYCLAHLLLTDPTYACSALSKDPAVTRFIDLSIARGPKGGFGGEAKTVKLYMRESERFLTSYEKRHKPKRRRLSLAL